MKTKFIPFITLLIVLICAVVGFVSAQVHPKIERADKVKYVDPITKHHYIQIGMDCTVIGITETLKTVQMSEEGFKKEMDKQIDACVKGKLKE